MSVEPTIKLNLKALKTHNNVNTDTETVTTKTDTPITDSDSDSADTSTNTSTDKNSSSHKSKSHNISFADLKKQIDSKSDSTEPSTSGDIQTVAGEDDIVSEVKTTQIKIDKNISEVPKEKLVNEKIHQSKANNKVNEISKHTEKEKTILAEEKDEEQTKKSLFGSFSRKKSNTKQDSIVYEKNNSESVQVPSKENKEIEKIHFSNYESHFKKESTNFLKRFQKFKYTPSTRVGMIGGLITITSITIASLMIIFPEKHSLSLYKASILEITSSRDISSQNISPITSPIIPEEKIDNIITSEDTQIDDTSQDTTDIDTSSIHEETSKEILRQHLLNKYK